MIITIDGKPISKNRVRAAKRGDYIHMYSDQADKVDAVKLLLKSKWHYAPIEKSVSVKFKFYMPITKSTSKKDRAGMLSGETHHTSRPDLDNMVKFYMDCMNGIIWKDDSLVVTLSARKLYGEEARTEIDIKRARIVPSPQLEILERL